MKFWDEFLDFKDYQHYNKQFNVLEVSSLTEAIILLALDGLLFTQ